MPTKKTPPTPTAPKERDTPWEEAELRAAVLAYLAMQRKHTCGEKFVKTHVYASLAAQFPRSAKAFEMRMQNISFVLSQMGRNWLPGLKPAKNIGTANQVIIERLINATNAQQTILPLDLSSDAYALHFAPRLAVPPSHGSYQVLPMVAPAGIAKPKKEQVTIEQIVRDEKVRAWVLHVANGHCECCGAAAPFISDEGEPYLEIHHVRQLAHDGPDTPENAVAVCPNCHRELHSGMNSQALRERLYAQVARLARA